MSIRQNLAALDPTNMVWQKDLLVSLDRMGDIHFADERFRGRAGDAGRSPPDRRNGMVSLDPEDLPRQADLGNALKKIGDIKSAMGDRPRRARGLAGGA
jgi:hypothetical protein